MKPEGTESSYLSLYRAPERGEAEDSVCELYPLLHFYVVYTCHELFSSRVSF